jgi:hypothetical protein
LQDFPDASAQIEKVLAEDYEFKTEIPNPDVQPLFVPSQKFGKLRKSIAFEQSSEYHKIVGFDPQKVDLNQYKSSSVENRIEQALA